MKFICSAQPGNQRRIPEYIHHLNVHCGKHLQLRIEWFKNLGALADASKQGAVDALKDTNYQGIKITAGLFF